VLRPGVEEGGGGGGTLGGGNGGVSMGGSILNHPPANAFYPRPLHTYPAAADDDKGWEGGGSGGGGGGWGGSHGRGLAIAFQTIPVPPTASFPSNSTQVQLNILTSSTAHSNAFVAYMSAPTPQLINSITAGIKASLLASNNTAAAAAALTMNITAVSAVSLVYTKTFWALLLDWLYRNMVNVFVASGFLLLLVCLVPCVRRRCKSRGDAAKVKKLRGMQEGMEKIRVASARRGQMGYPEVEGGEEGGTSLLVGVSVVTAAPPHHHVSSGHGRSGGGGNSPNAGEQAEAWKLKKSGDHPASSESPTDPHHPKPTVAVGDVVKKFGVRASSILPASLRYSKNAHLESGALVASHAQSSMHHAHANTQAQAKASRLSRMQAAAALALNRRQAMEGGGSGGSLSPLRGAGEQIITGDEEESSLPGSVRRGDARSPYQQQLGRSDSPASSRASSVISGQRKRLVGVQSILPTHHTSKAPSPGGNSTATTTTTTTTVKSKAPSPTPPSEASAPSSSFRPVLTHAQYEEGGGEGGGGEDAEEV
jgi:hypothetical protein